MRAVIKTAVVMSLFFASSAALAAGIEFPDNGTIATGRGGAWAANPSDGMAFQYNPAGLAQQTGLRLDLGGRFSMLNMTFDSTDIPTGPIDRTGGGYLAPAATISYGLGKLGPLSGLTVALGATGPSSIGHNEFPEAGAQRYALQESNYFIAYYSLGLAAKYGDLVALGVTAQAVHGTAKFSQTVWTGSSPGTDPGDDAGAVIDVASGFIPTGVIGLTVTPIKGLAIGASFRPRIDFVAAGTLTAAFSDFATRAGAQQIGDEAELVLKFPDVYRVGVSYAIDSLFEAEIDFVWERWSVLETIEIQTKNIKLALPNIGTEKNLEDIVFQKDFVDAGSIRIGGDYHVLPERLTMRAGYLYETSAIPLNSTSVDFPNWGRHAVSVGASVALFGVWLDLAYAHHFIPSRTVTNSQVVQVVAPCLTTTTCTDTTPTVVGNGHYTASIDVIGISIRIPFDTLTSEVFAAPSSSTVAVAETTPAEPPAEVAETTPANDEPRAQP